MGLPQALAARTVVLHRCDLPICVRLDHLAVGSQRENLLMAAHRDRIARITFTGQRTDHADTRGPAGQSRAIRDALPTGITDPHQLTAIIDAVITFGARYADQLALFDL